MAGKIQLQKSLQKPYERRVFTGEVLTTIFQNRIQIFSLPINQTSNLSMGEASLMKQVLHYGKIKLDDDTTVTCYEITLHNHVRLEQNKISIQQYVRKLMVSGEVILINFIQNNSPHFWRLSLVSSDTKMADNGDIQDLKTNAKRYTYLLGASETCLTAATQMVVLEGKANIIKKDLVDAFSVEKVSKPFFEEYTKIHYKRFNDYLIASNFKASVFNGDEKAIRDFVKKLLGRIVFLYFVQKKGWLGCQDSKGWDSGDRNFISNLFKKSGGNDAFYPVWLSTLFFDTLNAPRPNNEFTMPDKSTVRIPFLNGGLFEKDKHDNSLITFPPAMFHNALNAETDKERGFLDFLDAYNFTVYEDSPDDHTVAVDPEMLGHIFENLLEDNKDKGTFYTPKEIVHYMCQESLVEYLGTKLTSNPMGKIEMGKSQSDMFGNASRKGQLALETPVNDKPEMLVQRTDIEDLIKNNRVNEGLQKYLKTIDKYLDDVRICDPAIGSGAFPMGLLHEIFNAKMLLYIAIHNTVPTPTQRVEMKLHIIQNSIYGVDIERGAVDIAQLRFWLSLIVDEQSPKALPNLDYKIVVGNSLVSKFEDDVITIDWEVKEGTQTDIFGGNIVAERRVDLLKKISQKQHAFFLPENHNKKEIAGQIRNLKIDLLMNQLELMVKNTGINSEPKLTNYKTKTLFMKAQEVFLMMEGWKHTIQKLKTLKAHPEKPFNHFDWKLDFPEILNPALVGDKTGFDIVIGNPPYVAIAKLADKNILQKQNFETFESTGDLYCLFYEKGLQLLKNGGIETYITSSQWLKANYGKSLKAYFLKQNPLLLLALGPGIFESATVDSNILMMQKNPYQKALKGLIVEKAQQINTPNAIHLPNITADSWAISNGIKQQLNQKILAKSKPLKNWEVNIYFGVKTGYNEAFIIDGAKRNELIDADESSDEIIMRVLRGRGVEKYHTEWDGSYLVNTLPSLKIDIDDYPAIKKYLESFGKKLHQIGEEFFDKNNQLYKTRKKTSHEWFETQDPIAFYEEFSKEKIIWKRIGSKLRFSYSDHTIFCLDSTCIATGEKIKYLTALLNSKLCHYQLFENAPKTGMGDLIISVQALEPLLVYYPNDTEEQPFIRLVDKILLGKKSGLDTSIWEAEIDELVYALYDLTAAEIAVVAGR